MLYECITCMNTDAAPAGKRWADTTHCALQHGVGGELDRRGWTATHCWIHHTRIYKSLVISESSSWEYLILTLL